MGASEKAPTRGANESDHRHRRASLLRFQKLVRFLFWIRRPILNRATAQINRRQQELLRIRIAIQRCHPQRHPITSALLEAPSPLSLLQIDIYPLRLHRRQRSPTAAEGVAAELSQIFIFEAAEQAGLQPLHPRQHMFAPEVRHRPVTVGVNRE